MGDADCKGDEMGRVLPAGRVSVAAGARGDLPIAVQALVGIEEHEQGLGELDGLVAGDIVGSEGALGGAPVCVAAAPPMCQVGAYIFADDALGRHVLEADTEQGQQQGDKGGVAGVQRGAEKGGIGVVKGLGVDKVVVPGDALELGRQ